MTIPLRLALRDLRGGLAGLRLLAVCLFLGVTALAGVGSLSAAVVAGLLEQGQAILGGDVQVEMAQRGATPEELALFQAEGEVSRIVRMRAMAASPEGDQSLLIELKAVDDAYPLYGTLRVEPGSRPAGREVAVARELAERLGLGIGDAIRIGRADLRISGYIAEEPDRVSQGFALGPAAIVDMEGLAATGLVQPGSLYESAYRIRIPPAADPGAVRERIEQAFPDAGIDIDDRTNAAPGMRRFLDRLGQFLALVGLAALVIAGIGVGNGVSSYLDGKRGSIATLKMLGATSRTIFSTWFIQVGMVAAAAIAAGLAAGALVPAAAVWAAGDAMPVPPRLSLYPAPLLLAALYGLLIAFVFALLPLARARTVPAATLFRGDLERLKRPGWPLVATAAVAAVAIAALAVATASERLFAAGFVAVAMGAVLLLAGLGWAIRCAAARLPRPRNPVFRLAFSNLHRPGAQTGRLVVALGLGFTLFTALAVVETNLAGQIRTTIPERAPSFFLLDIPSAEVARFRSLAAATAPDGELVLVPSVRGSVVALGETRVSEMEEIPEGAWFLRGDRGLTFLGELPHGNRVVAGEWWTPGYSGPPLVSVDVEAANAVGLEVGETLTVSILGREIEARVASLREIDWDTMGFNFVLIFSPGALENAPHSYMATVALDEAREAGFQQAVANAFPTVSLIRVKDVVETFSTMLAQLSAAIRAAAAVAILAGIAVLIGALAASRRARIYDSVVLKMLGATRGRILAAQAIEFAMLAAILCVVALTLGAAAGWYVVVEIFELEWAPAWGAVGATLGAGALITLILGLAGSLPALAARPTRALRSL